MPSKVTYDRKHSAFTEYDLSKVDVDELLEGYDWLHMSGINPRLLGDSCAYICAALPGSRQAKRV